LAIIAEACKLYLRLRPYFWYCIISLVAVDWRYRMIGCISPTIGNCEQTLNTLRYADRVKERNSVTGEIVGGAKASTTAGTGKNKPITAAACLLSKALSAFETGDDFDTESIDEILTPSDASSADIVSDEAIARQSASLKLNGAEAEGDTESLDEILGSSPTELQRTQSISRLPIPVSAEHTAVEETGQVYDPTSLDALLDSFDSNPGSDTEADMLDDLLSSPPPRQPIPTSSSDGSNIVDVSNGRRRTAMMLMESHKMAMTKMLTMLQDEMEMVNEADADRDGLQDYIDKLNTIQEKQLSYIVALREQLLEYHMSGNVDDTADLAVASSDGGSFVEDLRY
jgi:hypothetical protein